MSVLVAGRRSVASRRISQATLHGMNTQLQWPSPATLRSAGVTLQGRRRALDLYGTKDILFSHEQMKRAKQLTGNSKGARTFGWVSSINVHFFITKKNLSEDE